ncbi:hypothetical protein LTR53_012989 [Teratosphaeriaceae sp. CCFEE 6253]|nr:hypothetical protein LTR53_012989 [Teratosphaeriaceae sp. CCFEE 6253]
MELGRLKVKAESVRPATSGGKKRKKAADEDVIMAPRSPKRAKRDASPDLDVERDFDFSEVGEIGNILMRSLFEAHAVLKSHGRTEPLALAHHLVRAASALPQVIQQAVQTSFVRPIKGLEMLKTTLTAAGKAVVSLVVGISRLCKVADGAEIQGQVVYAYVQMFAPLLVTLETASEHETKKTTTQTPTAAASKRPSTSKGKAIAQQAKQPNVKDITSLNLITCFLCGIVDMLDAKSDVHKQLFDGFAYCTLDKLGTRLYTSVFGHVRPSTVADEIARSNPADEIEDAGPEAAPLASDLAIAQAKMEAPYLVHLLSHLMAAAPPHLGAIISTKTGKAKQAKNRGSMKGALAIHAKDRLQRTLVNCMFGIEGVDEDDPFMDCLKMPSMVGQQPLPMPKVKEVEVQEWFKSEVWRLLGWEILGKEGGW